MLKEIHDSRLPFGIEPDLLAGIHQHLVRQHQRRQPALGRNTQQLRQQRFRRRRLALRIFAIGVNGTQAVAARELIRQHAPRMAQSARLAIRRFDVLDAFLDVDLVEAQRGHERLRQIAAYMLAELAHRGHVRQRGGIAEQVIERDECMCLAAAIGELQLPHGLVALPAQSNSDILHQFA